MYKAIFLDIDGTLVSFKTHLIPQSTVDALTIARQRGIKIIISTGRPPHIITNLGQISSTGTYLQTEHIATSVTKT